jgi:recombination protein RecA
MARKAKEAKAGRVGLQDLMKLVNKKAGRNVAHDLTGENPTSVKEWIPTGSRWLDSIISKGQIAGIPVGKVTEIAGLEATGKSYMAAQIAANAQKTGKLIVYFDSESAIDPVFLEQAGCDLERLMYIQASSVEFVLETVEELLGAAANEQLVFIWDSLALTPSVSDVEGDFNPQSSMAVKARILAKGMSKLIIPIADAQATFIVLNQLKTNIPSGPNARIIAMTTPYMTPGGKAMHYSYSLRIWLTGRKAKSAFIEDEKGFRIGSEVKVKLEKSRFGTQGRSCAFRILWGNEVGIRDEESWFDAIKGSASLVSAGAWYTLKTEDGYEKKFQPSKWGEIIKEDHEFRSKVISIMDEEIIQKFDMRQGSAKDFYEDQEDLTVPVTV